MPMWFVLTQVKNGDSPSSTDTLTLADGRRHGPCSNPSSEQTLSHGFVLETTIRSLTKVHHVAMSTSNHFVSHPFPHLSASPTTYLPPLGLADHIPADHIWPCWKATCTLERKHQCLERGPQLHETEILKTHRDINCWLDVEMRSRRKTTTLWRGLFLIHFDPYYCCSTSGY